MLPFEEHSLLQDLTAVLLTAHIQCGTSHNNLASPELSQVVVKQDDIFMVVLSYKKHLHAPLSGNKAT